MDNKEIIFKLDELRRTSDELDIPEAGRSELIKEVTAYAEQFISSLKNTKGFFQKEVNSLAITNQKIPFKAILDLYQKEVAENGINAASGRHLGYIPGGGVFAAALADFIAAVTNPYAGVFYASPGAVTIENEVINWLKTIFSFPEDSVGCLSSGGSISTLIAFTAARDKYKVKNELVRKSVIYLSEHVHHSTQKALRIIGLEDAIIRCVPIDSCCRMKADSLEKFIGEDLKQGLHPFLITATAGTTDTGAIDPLNEIADISEKNKLWFHVDAAYGGFFILTSRKKLFKGIDRADSLIIDPHKGMFLPYGVGAVLVKDKFAVLNSNHYSANYMQDTVTEEVTASPSNLSPELTKHFRGLRIWLPLLLHGIEPFAACLEEKLLLVKYFRNKLHELGFFLGPEPELSVSYFWFPFESNTDQMNKQLMKEIHNEGSVFLSSSTINNRFVIRIAILAFRTKKETVDEAIDMIERCLLKVKRKNRKRELHLYSNSET